MSRAILVIGPQGSGSSAVAGAMNSLGISMGLDLKGASSLNPKGHFECLVFEKLALKWNEKDKEIIANLSEVQEVFKEYVLKRNKEGVWGLKMPLMISFVPFIVPFVDECRMVSIDRPAEACLKSSMIKYPNLTRDSIEYMHNIIRIRRLELIERYSMANLDVDYNDLTSNTREVVSGIADFCFEGLERPSQHVIDSAIAFVEPTFNHRREIQ